MLRKEDVIIRFEVRRADHGFKNALAVTIFLTPMAEERIQQSLERRFSFSSTMSNSALSFDKLGPSVQGLAFSS